MAYIAAVFVIIEPSVNESYGDIKRIENWSDVQVHSVLALTICNPPLSTDTWKLRGTSMSINQPKISVAVPTHACPRDVPKLSIIHSIIGYKSTSANVKVCIIL